jgi:hypothetical protein
MDGSKHAGLQRLFQKDSNKFVLLHRNGNAVAFQLAPDGGASVVDRQTDVSFHATGRALLDEGWKCVGPGSAYSGLFESDDPSETETVCFTSECKKGG